MNQNSSAAKRPNNNSFDRSKIENERPHSPDNQSSIDGLGEENASEFSNRLRAGLGHHDNGNSVPHKTQKVSVEGISSRFLEGYHSAQYIINYGNSVKFSGFILGAIVILSALQSNNTMSAYTLLIGILVLLVAQVLGTIISGLGQTQRAIIDIAVNTSTELSIKQRKALKE